MKRIFLVTKPLQYINALNIANQLGGENSLCVVDLFKNAETIFSLIQKDLNRLWKSCFFIKNRWYFSLTCLINDFDEIFIDSDVGVFINITLLFNIKKRNICVYEEGLGVYRNDLKFKFGRKFIYNFLGGGRFFGDNHLTQRIYVYDTDKYIKNTQSISRKKIDVVNIKTNYLEFIKQNKVEFVRIFFANHSQMPSITKKKAIIYFSSWEIDDNVIRSISEEDADIYLKPHPHIKKKIDSHSFYSVVPAEIPGELLLLELQEKYQSIIVYHHGSSIAHYIFKNNSKIVFFRV